MTFRFNTRKGTEVAALLIQREGGCLNIMKLLKLAYLLDRLSIQVRGIPVVGGVYLSLKNGPATSELLDLVNAGKIATDSDDSWERFISHRDGHNVALREEPPIDFLSESEVRLVDKIYESHGGKDQWEIRDWCHQHCGEWNPLQVGALTIAVEEIATNVGKSEAEVRRISDEAQESNLLDSVFHAVPPVHA